MEFRERLYQLRKGRGISQEELGARLGVSRQAVSKWETGAAAPDMENLLALAREFGVSVAELTATPTRCIPAPHATAIARRVADSRLNSMEINDCTIFAGVMI